jgi:DNA-binding LacI/PurR family transcriptional regulator
VPTCGKLLEWNYLVTALSMDDFTRQEDGKADPGAALRRLVQKSVGRRLPSERVLASALNISRPSLRALLAQLQREGLVEARPKSGTYVLDDRESRLKRIVLLVDEDLKLNDDPFILTIVDRLQREIQSIGARCIVERCASGERALNLEDGVLTLGMAARSLIDARRSEDPPMVGLFLDESARPNRRASIFQLDDRDAGRTAAERLIGRGCRNIVFAGRRDLPVSRDRLAGAGDAAAIAGVGLHFVSAHLNCAAGIGVGRDLELLDELDSAGLIATNDWLALGLRMGMRDRKSAVAREIPIVSFDGLSVVQDPFLAIESLAVPIDDIARDAIEELRRLHRSPAASGRTVRYTLQLGGGQLVDKRQQS